VSVYDPSPIKHQRRSRVERAALDRLLLQRFQGKVGRGLAIQLARRRGASKQAESLFTSVLTGYTGQDESCTGTGNNGQMQTLVCRRTKGA
jgi:hypothetical protein